MLYTNKRLIDSLMEFSQTNLNHTHQNHTHHNHSGISVLTVMATDPDDGLNGSVRYHLLDTPTTTASNTSTTPTNTTSNTSATSTTLATPATTTTPTTATRDLFSIDSSVGLIRTRRGVEIDREVKSSYELVVVAVDRGSPPLSCWCCWCCWWGVVVVLLWIVVVH